MASPPPSDGSHSDDEFVVPASASSIQVISIRQHVPVTLDMEDANYGQWKCFFDSALGKFGLLGHVRSTTPSADRDGEWRTVDSCVVNWILATVSKGVFDIIRRDRADAFTLWHAIEGLFQDNELQRAVYLEAELCTLQQGDMSINDFCTKLKRLADQLRDIGHPVSEPSQVLNLLRGLNPKYRYVKPVITAKYPPHTFMSARSFLLLEELSLQHDTNAEATQALAASHGDRSSGSSNSGNHSASHGSNDGSSASRDNNCRGNGGGNRSNNRGDRRRGRGNGGGNSGNGGGTSRTSNSNNQNAPWATGYNPWQGMVQAWPMLFRAPGAGVLGPRPPF
ncbi:uncharacterized protein [Miscanthus floridulus]|uniref:uncharacterized protein n=1 Tax=Miscanthus floridulus TaxID=154761 RepID=UPI00345AD820